MKLIELSRNRSLHGLILTTVLCGSTLLILVFVKQGWWALQEHIRTKQKEAIRASKLFVQLRREQQSDARIAVVGASHVEGLCTACDFRFHNFGIAGDTTGDALDRILAYQTIRKSESCTILALGFNDIEANVNTYANVTSLLSSIGSTRVAVLSLFPVHKGRSSLYPKMTAVNAQLRSACVNDTPRCSWVDMSNIFNEGERVHEADGVHLSIRGYQLLLNSIKSTAGKLGC